MIDYVLYIMVQRERRRIIILLLYLITEMQ
jgi:hypothetical protein